MGAWEEIRTAKATGPRDALAVEILLRTGVRLSQAVRITLGDIQGANIPWRPRAAPAAAAEALASSAWPRARAASSAGPPSPSSLQRLIKIYVERFRPDVPHERLFTHADGTQMSSSGFQTMFRRLHRKRRHPKVQAHVGR